MEITGDSLGRAIDLLAKWDLYIAGFFFLFFLVELIFAWRERCRFGIISGILLTVSAGGYIVHMLVLKHLGHGPTVFGIRLW